MDIPVCTWYPGILSIVGLTYSSGVAWISQDTLGVPIVPKYIHMAYINILTAYIKGHSAK